MLFSKTVLPSGLRVLSEKMPEVRSVSIGIWVGAGSRDEPRDAQGASHLLEHLLFKGTEKRSARDIAEAFDAVGGEANAFSAKEYTCLYARVLDEDLPMAVEILADMIRNAALRPEDLESERQVVLEEIALRDDMPDDLVHDLFAESTFGDHPLAREIMGNAETVAAITPQSLGDFYGENYHASNIVVAAAGGIDHTDLLGWIEPFFSSDTGRPLVRSPSPPSPASRLRLLRRETEQAHIVLGGVGYSRHHPDRFSWGVLDTLLGGGNSSRLFQEVRERRGLAYAVYSYRNQYSDTGLWGVYAGTAPGKVNAVLDVVTDELDRLVTSGPEEVEVERAKGHTKGSLVLSLEDPASRMSRVGRSELIHGEIYSLDELVARINAVTVEDVARVARDLLASDRRVLCVIGPFTQESLSWKPAA